MKALIPVLAVLALVGISTPQAQAASVSYSLNFDTCTGTCGTGPFGTVTLTQTVADVISVNVTLLNGARFVNTGVGPTSRA
jgi:hypothetical protein